MNILKTIGLICSRKRYMNLPGMNSAIGIWNYQKRFYWAMMKIKKWRAIYTHPCAGSIITIAASDHAICH